MKKRRIKEVIGIIKCEDSTINQKGIKMAKYEYSVSCPFCKKLQKISLSRNPKHEEELKVECKHCEKEFITKILKTKCPHCGKYFNGAFYRFDYKSWICPYCEWCLGKHKGYIDETGTRSRGKDPGSWGEFIKRGLTGEYGSRHLRQEDIKKASLEDIDTNGQSGCFIATAVYGTLFASEINILRRWRDKSLLQKKGGKLFVKIYYRVSPPIAKYISKSEKRRWMTRLILKPIIKILKKGCYKSSIR